MLRLVPWLGSLLLLASHLSDIRPADGQTIDQSPDERTSKIEKCLISALLKQLPSESCIGLVSQPCRDTQHGATTVGANECLAQETEVWDNLLNKAYRQVITGAADEERSKIRESQRAWLQFRSKFCDWPYQVYKGGTLAGVLSGECMMRETGYQVVRLKLILDHQRFQ